MNAFTRIGQWVEKHFPEKITAEAVYADISILKTNQSRLFTEYELMLKRIHTLELALEDMKKIKEDAKKLQSELETLKTQSSIKMRVAGSVPDTMTPFASRLPPVQPNGGAK